MTESDSSWRRAQHSFAGAISILFAAAAVPAGAEDGREEITVTGTSIQQTSLDLPSSVAVLRREELEKTGSLSMVDLLRNFSGNLGSIGENGAYFSDSSQSVLETVANVNLRGLGASRTLVLFNGRRQVYVPARRPGGRFVDVNTLPAIALDRIEILKEGASAVYGSDAIAGVANFITRSDFTGLELVGSHEAYDSGGDSLIGGIWGGDIGSAHAVVALEHVRRRELTLTERDYAIRPFSEAGPRTWSTVGNPGSFWASDPANDMDNDAPVRDAQLAFATRTFIDPACTDFGGLPHPSGATCRYRYAPFFSLIEEQYNTRFFTELNGAFNDRHNYHFEALWSKSAVPHPSSSPSFPPVRFFNGTQLVAPDHPGRVAFVEDHPTNPVLDPRLPAFDAAGSTENWWFLGRTVGNAGPGRVRPRDSRTWRMNAALDGVFDAFQGKEFNYDLAASYSHTQSNVGYPAEYARRVFLAFRGYGGPNCGVGVVVDPNHPSGMGLGDTAGKTPGQGDCMYYNPFGNAVEFSAQPGAPFRTSPNPEYDPALANSPELLEWMREDLLLHSESELFVLDMTVGSTWEEMELDYVFGYQFRRLDAEATPNAAGNIDLHPCPVAGDTTCAEQGGPFVFTTGFSPYRTHQTTHSFYAEAFTRFADRLDAQVAARYEEHEESSTFDPKLSLSWELSETLALRGSAQTTFRAPSVDELNESAQTQLQLINAVGAYKAIDIRGNKDLEPETAFTYNLGVVYQSGTGVNLSVDYWQYRLEDQIRLLPHNGVVDTYVGLLRRQAAGETLTAAEMQTFAAARALISCPGDAATEPGMRQNCSPVTLERVSVPHINGPEVRTSGIDFHASLTSDLELGELSLGLDGTYVLEYEVDALTFQGVVLAEEQKLIGHLNDPGDYSFPSLPRWKASAYVGWEWDDYSLINTLNYVSSYADRSARAPNILKIDDHLTWDAHFQWKPPSGNMTLTFSVLNITDEEPPLALTEKLYDGQTHNAKDRRLKLNFRYDFDS